MTHLILRNGSRSSPVKIFGTSTTFVKADAVVPEQKGKSAAMSWTLPFVRAAPFWPSSWKAIGVSEFWTQCNFITIVLLPVQSGGVF